MEELDRSLLYTIASAMGATTEQSRHERCRERPGVTRVCVAMWTVDVVVVPTKEPTASDAARKGGARNDASERRASM